MEEITTNTNEKERNRYMHNGEFPNDRKYTNCTPCLHNPIPIVMMNVKCVISSINIMYAYFFQLTTEYDLNETKIVQSNGNEKV